MMKLSDTDLSREAREAVESGMKPGEELVRVDTPQVPFLVDLSGGNIGYVVVLVMLAFMGVVLWQGEKEPDLLAILSAVAAVGLGIQLRMQALRRGARYLLTTQRAIICRQGFFGGGKLQVFGLHPGMTEEVQQDRLGRGHLVFDYTDYAVNGEHLPIGFLWLRDVNATLEVLNGLLETVSPEQTIEHAEEEDLPQQSNRFWQKMIVVIVCFAIGVFSLIRGIVHALALQQNADAERWLGALLPAIVGLIFVGGGIAAVCSRK